MKKEQIMKRLIIGSSLAIALVLATTGSAQAQEKGSAKGGGQQLMKPIKTVQDVEALEAGDMAVAPPREWTMKKGELIPHRSARSQKMESYWQKRVEGQHHA